MLLFLTYRLWGSLSLHFDGHFLDESGLAGVYWSKGWWWWWQLDYWSYKSCKAPVKPTSSFLQAGCPSYRPTNSVKALKGKCHIPWTCYPKLTWVLPTLSLATNSSWLPWVRVAMPLISPIMPVPLWRTGGVSNENMMTGVSKTCLDTVLTFVSGG